MAKQAWLDMFQGQGLFQKWVAKQIDLSD